MVRGECEGIEEQYREGTNEEEQRRLREEMVQSLERVEDSGRLFGEVFNRHLKVGHSVRSDTMVLL